MDQTHTHVHTQTRSIYSWRRSQAGLSEMEHPHKTESHIKANIPANRISGSAWLHREWTYVHSEDCLQFMTIAEKRGGGTSIDKHTSIIRAAVMCHPLCTSRRAVGDLEEAGIPSRLSGKSG